MMSPKSLLLVVASILFLMAATSASAATMPAPGFTTQFSGGIGFDESLSGTPFPFGAPPCTTSTCALGIELGDVVLCDGLASSCGATVVSGFVTGYTGPVSDIITFRADPTNPNGILINMYSDLDTAADVFVNPPAGPTSNFVIIAEAPFTTCPNSVAYGPNCEFTVYIPPGPVPATVGYSIVSDTSLPATTTPEPSSLVLLGSGLLGIGGLLRRLGLSRQ
jgi:hypothetical protein